MNGDHLAAAAAALEALDAESLVGLYADGFVFEDIPSGETITTREGLAGYFEGLFSLPDVSFSGVDFFRSGGRGAGTWVWSGTNRNGESFSVRGASVFDLTAEGAAGDGEFEVMTGF